MTDMEKKLEVMRILSESFDVNTPAVVFGQGKQDSVIFLQGSEKDLVKIIANAMVRDKNVMNIVTMAVEIVESFEKKQPKEHKALDCDNCDVKDCPIKDEVEILNKIKRTMSVLSTLTKCDGQA